MWSRAQALCCEDGGLQANADRTRSTPERGGPEDGRDRREGGQALRAHFQGVVDAANHFASDVVDRDGMPREHCSQRGLPTCFSRPALGHYARQRSSQ